MPGGSGSEFTEIIKILSDVFSVSIDPGSFAIDVVFLASNVPQYELMGTVLPL